MKNTSPFARRTAGGPVLFETLEGRQLLAAHPAKATAIVKRPTKPAVIATPLVNNVSGIVYYDNHGDGVYDTPIDTPQGGVFVYLDVNNNGDWDGNSEAITTSAANGSYSFTNVAAGVPIRELPSPYYVSTTNATAGVTPTGTGTNYNIGNFNATINASSLNGITEASIDSTHTWLTVQTTFGLNPTYYRVRQNLITRVSLIGTSGDDQLTLELGSGGEPSQKIDFSFNGNAGTDTVLVRAPAAGWTKAEFDNDNDVRAGNFAASGGFEQSVYQGSAGDDSVKLYFNNSVTFYGGGGNDVIDTSAGTYTPPNDLGVGYDGELTNHVTLIAPTTATINLTRTQHLAGLKLTGGSVVMTNGANLHTHTFLRFSGNLDPGTGAVVIDDTTSINSSSQLDIANAVKAGYANGQQNGGGIRSVMSAGTNYRIGYALAGDALSFGSSNTATFFGETVGVDTMLIRRTLVGDADLDGGVSINDFNRVARRFGTPSGAFWSGGDFDYDFGVSINDFNLLAANFGKTA